ncbi:MAG TPA: hypothetical protein VNW50_01645 [Streptosporangiaceae bacterium]|nr:hypothetical protein [Streptosporangiaceae bacterium]
MSGTTISVQAQWALHGKVLDDEGYQVIACSNGDLNRANFADALGRFTPGQLASLPQVSVSYLQPATRSPGGGYLTLAIHWFAAPGQRYADGVGQVDNQGRITTFTSYFCAPYASLAPKGTTYLDMYRAFSAVTLPAKDGPPKEVSITPSAQQIPSIDALALRVAPLLLTGAPVCVLGADETSLDERLRFIDTVMGLLPYGFRARMAAATWTRPTHRNHRFRLFFSSEPRASEKPDQVVLWGEPELARIPGGDAGHYYGWLADKVTPLASLAQLYHELGFGDSADSQALELVDKVRLWRRPRLRPMAPDAPEHAPARLAPPATRVDTVARLLRECADDVRALNLSRLRQDLNLLQNQVESGWIDDSHRRRYQVLISKFGLLSPNARLGKWEGKLHEALLALAFGRPITYKAFCQVEDCVRNPPGTCLDRSLLEAMEKVGLADKRAKVIVSSSLDPKKLARLLGSREMDAYGLIGELARGGWYRQEHGRLFCDAMLQYLTDRQGRYSTAEIRRVLLRNGFLARALRDVGHGQYQVHALTKLLLAAFPTEHYPHGLDKATITEILARTPDAPTPALLAAILRKIPVNDAPAAWDAYVYGSIARMDFDEATHGALWTRLPTIEQEPQLEPPPKAQPLPKTEPLPQAEPLPASLPAGQGLDPWPGQEHGLEPPRSRPGAGEELELEAEPWLRREPGNPDDA